MSPTMSWYVSGTDGTSTTALMPITITTDMDTESGTKAKFNVKKETSGISPELYFSYVKSKLSKMEVQKLQARMKKLNALLKESEELGQDALYEHTAQLLAIVIRESELVSCGIIQWLERKTIDKFINQVKEKEIMLDKLENFPRIIPDKQKRRISAVKKKKLFDDIWILYTKAPKEEALETNKRKIERRDPIAFGTFAYQPNIYYHICSWEDAYCNITLDKLVETMQKNDSDYKLNNIPDINQEMMDSIVKEVKIRHERLQNTNRDNYKKLMEEEEAEKQKRKEAAEKANQDIIKNTEETFNSVKEQANAFSKIWRKFFGR